MKSNAAGGRGRVPRHSYVCRRTGGHVLRNVANLDEYVANVILERLAKEKLLVAKGRGDNVGQLQDERAAWVEKLDQLVDLLEDGTLDSPRARQRAAWYKAEVAKIDRELAAALNVSPKARLMASEDLRERWEQMDATQRSQVIDEVVTVTVLPTKRGRGFDPDAIDIAWKEYV